MIQKILKIFYEYNIFENIFYLTFPHNIFNGEVGIHRIFYDNVYIYCPHLLTRPKFCCWTIPPQPFLYSLLFSILLAATQFGVMKFAILVLNLIICPSFSTKCYKEKIKYWFNEKHFLQKNLICFYNVYTNKMHFSLL